MISIDKLAFSKALDAVSSVIKAKASIPILRYVKLEAIPTGDTFFTATDLDCFYQRVIEGKVSKAFSCLLPVRMVKEWLGGVGQGTLTIGAAGQKLKLTVGTNSIEIASLDVKDFPQIPNVARALMAKADFAPLASVMNAAPDTDARLELFDVPVHPAPGGMMACAADGRMFATRAFDGIIYGEAVIHIIPPMVGHLTRLGLCEVHDCGSFTQFSGEGFTLLIKKLAAKTLDMLAAMKRWTFDVSALLIREELLEAVNSCHVLRRERETEFITITGEDGRLKISCVTKQDEFSQSLAAKVEGDFQTVILPSTDVLAALRQSDEETAVISVTNPVVNARLSLGHTTFYFQACRFT